MAFVLSPAANQSASPLSQDLLNQLLILISLLRGGESRYLPLVMTKIRDTLPNSASRLPQHLVQKAALRPAGPGVSAPNSSGASVGPILPPPLSGASMSGFTPIASGTSEASIGMGSVHVKNEGSTHSSSSGHSSPYDTPPFMHYYPLA